MPGVYHQDVDGLFLIGAIVEPAHAEPVVARECSERVPVLLGPGHVRGPNGERNVLGIGLGVTQVREAERNRLGIGRVVEDRGINPTGGQRGEAVSGRLGEDEIDVARFQSGRGQERLDVNERDVVIASDADQLALEIRDLLDGRLGEDRVGRRHDVADDEAAQDERATTL